MPQIKNKSKVGNISYFGWVGHNNLGDEAILLANKKLFNQHHIIPNNYSNFYNVALFGGGTVVPPAKDIFAAAKQHEQIFGIGIGVKDPLLRNQKFNKVDLAYILGKIGKNELLRNKFVSYLLNPVDYISDSVGTYDHYVHEDSFDRLRDFDRLGVRGPISEQILLDKGIDCEVVGDTALVLEPSQYSKQSTNRVAVSMRPGSFKWGDNEDHLDTIIRYCQSESEKFEFVFVPLNPKDIPYHISASNKIDNAKFIDYSTTNNVKSLLNLYAKCDAVIGERLHASILSACCYTPFVSIEYRTKNSDFVQSVDMESFNCPCNEITESWLRERVNTCVEDEQVRNQLKMAVDTLRNKIDSYAHSLKEDMDVSYN